MSRPGFNPRPARARNWHFSLVDTRCMHLIESYKRPHADGTITEGNGRATMSVSRRSPWYWVREIRNGRWAGPRIRARV